MELQVRLGGAPPVTLLPPEDFQVEVMQDGVKQTVPTALVLPMMSRERKQRRLDGRDDNRFRRQFRGAATDLHPGAG